MATSLPTRKRKAGNAALARPPPVTMAASLVCPAGDLLLIGLNPPSAAVQGKKITVALVPCALYGLGNPYFFVMFSLLFSLPPTFFLISFLLRVRSPSVSFPFILRLIYRRIFQYICFFHMIISRSSRFHSFRIPFPFHFMPFSLPLLPHPFSPLSSSSLTSFMPFIFLIHNNPLSMPSFP